MLRSCQSVSCQRNDACHFPPFPSSNAPVFSLAPSHWVFLWSVCTPCQAERNVYTAGLYPMEIPLGENWDPESLNSLLRYIYSMLEEMCSRSSVLLPVTFSHSSTLLWKDMVSLGLVVIFIHPYYSLWSFLTVSNFTFYHPFFFT